MSKIRRLFLLLLLVFSVLAIPSRFKLLTYGFKLEKLQLNLPFSPQWEIEPILSEGELKKIFSQTFFFLGKGAQSYVFESEDEQYVLKLFRFDPRKRSFTDREKWDMWKEKKAISLFTSCKLSWVRAREETALLHLHLNPTSKMLPVLKIKTPLDRTLHLELDQYRFALQKKVVPLEKALDDALTDGTLSLKLTSLRSLLEGRTEKKIRNRDPSLWRNFGFLGNQAVELDFGNYDDRPDFEDEKIRKKEVDRYLTPLRKWLMSHHISELDNE